MSKEFKVGDKVYLPETSTRVFTVEANSRDSRNYNVENYPLDINGYSMTIDGKSFVDNELPSIFHATPENHDLLEKLYGVEFEKPPTPPSSREIIKAMLERGDKNVLCWVGNTRKEAESGYLWKFITEYNENSDYPYVSEGRGSVGSWVFAIPIDHRTEQPITEMPE